MSEETTAVVPPPRLGDALHWRGCRCMRAELYCPGYPNVEGPSTGALCADCDGSGADLPHLAHAPGWRPSWSTP